MTPMKECIRPKRLLTGKWWDKAWSLTSGCTPVSPGCAHCWAAGVASRFHQHPLYTGTAQGGKWTGEVRFNQDQLDKPLDKPLHGRKRRVYAVWNDLFHPAVPFSFVEQAMVIMALCPQHWFVVLTKRPDRMRKYQLLHDKMSHRETHTWGLTWLGKRTRAIVKALERERPQDGVHWPLPNVILGTSAEDQKRADERIPILLDTPAAYRMASYEPALGAVNWLRPMGWYCGPPTQAHGMHEGLDWVVAGSETGPGKRPCDLEWLRQARDQCAAAGTAFFCKHPHTLDGKAYREFPA